MSNYIFGGLFMSRNLEKENNDLYAEELQTLEEQLESNKHSYKDAFAELKFMLFKEFIQEKLGEKCNRIFVSFDDFDRIIYASTRMGEGFWLNHLAKEIRRQGINLDAEFVIFSVKEDGTGIFVKAKDKP